MPERTFILSHVAACVFERCLVPIELVHDVNVESLEVRVRVLDKLVEL